MASVARSRLPLLGSRSTGRLSTSSRLQPQCASCRQWQSLARLEQKMGSLAAVIRRPFSASATAQEKKYTKDHEWVELSDDGKMGTIGISTYAAHSLGDVVYVELPQIPMDVSGGDAIGAVESVKSASDIMTPISGNIVEANTKLEETPGLINREPEGATGWIAKIEIGEKGKSEWEGEELMGAEEYKSFTEE